MRSVWWRRALQQRLGTLAAAALILWTAGTAIAASVATRRIADALLEERRAHAAAVAARLEHALEEVLRQLDLVAAASSTGTDPAALAAHVRGLRVAESVLRVGPAGHVLWARAVVNGGVVPPLVHALARPADGRWHARPTGLVPTPGGPRVFLFMPARQSDPVGGAVAAEIDPAAGALRALVAPYAGRAYRVQIVDHEGHEIVASRRATPRESGTDVAQLVARAPVSHGPWQVRLVQPYAEALAPALRLRAILVGSSLMLLPFAVLVALAAARSIRQPVLTMTAAAERLAQGDYAGAIPAAGEDEIGRLALALEKLRTALEGDERRSLLLKRVISAQEEERRRIARELHDQTAQQLAALSMQLESIATAHPASASLLARSHALVRATIDDLHKVIHNLRPSVLDDLGLLVAIRSYAETRLAPAGIEVHCEFPDTLPELSHEATIALYRVVHEALTNVARHAAAESVLIGCMVTTDRLVLEIEDDGAGFEPARLAKPRESGEGLGLLGMRERLALLGGRVDIESEPGHGTRVVIVLPLAAHLAGSTPRGLPHPLGGRP